MRLTLAVPPATPAPVFPPVTLVTARRGLLPLLSVLVVEGPGAGVEPRLDGADLEPAAATMVLRLLLPPLLLGGSGYAANGTRAAAACDGATNARVESGLAVLLPRTCAAAAAAAATPDAALARAMVRERPNSISASNSAPNMLNVDAMLRGDEAPETSVCGTANDAPPPLRTDRESESSPVSAPALSREGRGTAPSDPELGIDWEARLSPANAAAAAFVAARAAAMADAMLVRDFAAW